MEYRGEIAIAKLLDIVDDAYYKYRALIETGNLSKKECYVAYRGDPNLKKENVLVRLELPFEEISDLKLDGAITSNFVTSTIPNGFESASSAEVIFYGMWNLEMRDGPNAPVISKIENYYDIGIIPSVLHFEYEYVHFRGRRRRIIVPYRLHGLDSEIMRYIKSNEILTIGGAWRRYARRVKKLPQSNIMPMVVTIDEKCLGKKVLDELDKTGLRLIEMEPQQ